MKAASSPHAGVFLVDRRAPTLPSCARAAQPVHLPGCHCGLHHGAEHCGRGPGHDSGSGSLIGLVAGSITLVGGHGGTAGAWGSVLENQYGLTGATTLGIACATFGLVIGGLLGGPLGQAPDYQAPAGTTTHGVRTAALRGPPSAKAATLPTSNLPARPLA
ncbi:hypothetical protein J4714_12995 [Staphylococcus epidermidis]|nr:hypothetical protein [Staphylococcus epidermidis]